eukprot:scaffold900_cov399-Pavlova_lutheri.AAC.2
MACGINRLGSYEDATYFLFMVGTLGNKQSISRALVGIASPLPNTLVGPIYPMLTPIQASRIVAVNTWT